MASTKANVRDRAANDLGILQLGQSLQSQDSTRIEQAYDEVYAELKKDGYATWAATGSVPDELTQHVVALVAFNCVGAYGVSPARYQRIVGAAALAKPEIRKLTTPDFESLLQPVDY